MKLKIIILGLVGASAISACNSNAGDSSQVSSTATNSVSSLASTAAVDSTIDVTDLNPQDWQKDWADQISKLSTDEQLKLKEIGYYVRASNVKLDKIYPGSSFNPENVKRIERLMPRANFEKTFPLTANHKTINGFDPADVYSYSNFLKAAAVLPGYCGDFSAYPGVKTAEMTNPDEVCKRMMATTFAHAVQETGSAKSDDSLDIQNKIVTTFSSVAEGNATPENRKDVGAYQEKSGPFSASGQFAAMVANKYYYGRGAKQLSYASNYANLSLMIYGNLLLVEDPDLVAGDNILPYLSALVYAVQPKNGRPSIAEVMDGNFKKSAQGAAANYAKLGFPFTIALVNGGPECKGTNYENTRTRLRSFKYFSQAGNLFTSGFALTDAETNATTCDNINPDDPSIWAASQRYYYFSPADGCTLVKWDSNNPIYGGSGYRQAVCNAPAPSPTSAPTPAPTPTSAPDVVDYNGFKLTVINDSNKMGIDKLYISDVRAKDQGFNLSYVHEAETLIFPNATPSNAAALKKLNKRTLWVTFSPTWEEDSEAVHTYNCSPFAFTQDTTVVIRPSSKAGENACETYPTDE